MAQKIYIVHGWTYTLDKWTKLEAELMSHDIEPVMLKVPGLTEPSDKVWDIPKYVQWLSDRIGDDENPVVVGHSNGGRIAMAYDVQYPNHLKHLFLIASAGVHHPQRESSAKLKLYKAIAKLVKPFARGKLRRLIYRLIGASDYGNATPNMQKTMRNVTDFDQSFDPSTVGVPTTLFWGSADTYTPLEDAKTLQESLQRVEELIVFPDTGHSPQDTHAEAIADKIASLLKED